MSKVPYASAIRFIKDAIIYTRLDLACSLGVASMYQSNLGKNHWQVVKSMLRYLRNTKDLWLVYGGSDMKLFGNTDSSFQSNKNGSKNMFGFVFTLYGGAVY